jgi:transposase
MTPSTTTSSVRFCGIDIAKRQHQAVLLDGTGQITKPAFTVTNDRRGFELLLDQLRQSPGPVTVALEATGHYWLALYQALTVGGHRVLVFNPLQIHAYRRSGVRPCKTDRSDAFWIADFARIGQGRPASESLPLFLQLRELTRFRSGLTAQVGDCKRKILCVLDRVFPEYETLFSNVFLNASRQLLATAVSAQEFADLDLEELAHLLQRSSRSRFGAEEAERLQAVARQSVGLPYLVNAARIEVRCLLEQLEMLEKQRQQVDQALEALMAELPQYLTTIPGIGPVTGASILAEIGDLGRFASLEGLVAYAGIDATVCQSGQFEAQQTRMSKRGSPHLRRALWQAAHLAIRYDPDLREYYERRRAEGKAHGTVLGAICRKLLARVYVVLKENRPYEVRRKPAQSLDSQ